MLTACDELPTLGGNASTSATGPGDYAIARAAAEDENYPIAIDSYQRVLAAYPRGRTGAEVRLEFAKVLLFADQPQRAHRVVSEVPDLTRNRELRGRAAILGVIAKHVELETYLAQEPPYIQARDKARTIYEMMESVYAKHGKYDEDAIIPARIRLLRESLAELELRQLHAERARGDVNIAAQRARYIMVEFADTDTVQRNEKKLTAIAA